MAGNWQWKHFVRSDLRICIPLAIQNGMAVRHPSQTNSSSKTDSLQYGHGFELIANSCRSSSWLDIRFSEEADLRTRFSIFFFNLESIWLYKWMNRLQRRRRRKNLKNRFSFSDYVSSIHALQKKKK